MSASDDRPGNRFYAWVAERPMAVGLALLALGAVVAFATAAGIIQTRSEVREVGSRVTRVESPCLRYGPKSQQCKAAFEAAVATITHAEACAVERKAGTLKAIRELAAELDVAFSEPCAGARLAQEKQRGDERAATREEGDASKPPASATQPSSSGTEGGGDQGGAVGQHPGGSKGGHPEAPSSPPAPLPTSTQPAPESTTADESPGASGEAPGQTIREAATGAIDTVGGAVDEAGKGVWGLVEGVRCGLGVRC